MSSYQIIIWISNTQQNQGKDDIFKLCFTEQNRGGFLRLWGFQERMSYKINW